MKKKIGIAMVLCLTSVPVISFAQSVPYQLSPRKCGVAAELGFQEDMTSLVGTFRHSMFWNISGSLTVGLGFVDEDLILGELTLPGFSIPPVPMLGMGFSVVNGLARTGLDCWSSVDFGAAFGELVYESTGRTVVSLRTVAIFTRVGLMKRIRLGPRLAFVPLAGVSNRRTWANLGSEIVNITRKTRSDSVWSGQTGVIVEVSSRTSIIGAVEFSFQEEGQIFRITDADRSRIILYGIALSFRL